MSRNAHAPIPHDMMTSSNGNIFRVTGLLCGEFTGPGEFPTQRPVTRSFDVYFDLRLNKRLSKQSWGWWLETLSCSLWRQSNDLLSYSGGAICHNLTLANTTSGSVHLNLEWRHWHQTPDYSMKIISGEWDHSIETSNGSWCMGIKGEMSGTVCVTFTWYMYIYELFIAFVCFVVCSLL